MKMQFENRVNLVMSDKHIDLIKQGIKTTTLRGMRHNYPIESVIRFYSDKVHGRFSDDDVGIFVVIIGKKLIRVPDGLTEEICKSEGNYTKKHLCNVLMNLGFKLPLSMWLYTFTPSEKYLKNFAYGAMEWP